MLLGVKIECLYSQVISCLVAPPSDADCYFSSSVLLSEANTGSVAQLTKLAVSERVTSDFARTVIKMTSFFFDGSIIERKDSM